MSCAEHNKELLGYTAKVYPYDSGYRCPRCCREWSHAQIQAAKNSANFRDSFISDDIIFDEGALV